MNLFCTNNINLKMFYFQKIHRFCFLKTKSLSLKKQTDGSNLLYPLSSSFFKSQYMSNIMETVLKILEISYHIYIEESCRQLDIPVIVKWHLIIQKITSGMLG